MNCQILSCLKSEWDITNACCLFQLWNRASKINDQVQPLQWIIFVKDITYFCTHMIANKYRIMTSDNYQWNKHYWSKYMLIVAFLICFLDFSVDIIFGHKFYMSVWWHNQLQKWRIAYTVYLAILFCSNGLSDRLRLDGICPHYSPALNLWFGLSVILSIRSSICSFIHPS